MIIDQLFEDDKSKKLNEADPRNFDSDVDYYAAQNAPAKARSHAKQSPGVNQDDEAYFREIFRKKRLAAQQAERSADHDRLATGTNEGEEMSTFAALKDWRVWDVTVMNNYYRGKYADYGPRLYSVVASSPEEARQVVLNNADYVLQDLLSRKLQSGKRVLPRGSALPVEEKRVGDAKPGSITTMGLKKMLTPDGVQSFKFAGGKIVDGSYAAGGEEQGVAEGLKDTVKQKAKEFGKYMTEPDTPQQAVVRDRAKNIAKIRKNKEQGVAEGLNDTIYPNAEVIKSKNGKPVGEIYQDESGWGCFHYKADNGADGMSSREEALDQLKDMHNERRHQGVAEGFSDIVKGVKRSVKGKEHPDVVVAKHLGRALGHYNQGDIKSGDKESNRYVKTRDMHLKAKGVAEGEQLDELSLGQLVRKGARAIGNTLTGTRAQDSSAINLATGKPYTPAELAARSTAVSAARSATDPTASKIPGEDPTGPNYVGRREVARRQSARDAEAAKKPAAPNFAQQGSVYKSANYAPNIKTGANLPGPAAPARPSTRVTAGGPTAAEKAALDKRIAAAASAQPVAETIKQIKHMMETVTTKSDVQRIKNYIDYHMGTNLTESARAKRSALLSEVTQLAAVRRREIARQTAK